MAEGHRGRLGGDSLLATGDSAVVSGCQGGVCHDVSMTAMVHDCAINIYQFLRWGLVVKDAVQSKGLWLRVSNPSDMVIFHAELRGVHQQLFFPQTVWPH